jgi:hypothetical protein
MSESNLIVKYYDLRKIKYMSNLGCYRSIRRTTIIHTSTCYLILLRVIKSRRTWDAGKTEEIKNTYRILIMISFG